MCTGAEAAGVIISCPRLPSLFLVLRSVASLCAAVQRVGADTGGDDGQLCRGVALLVHRLGQCQHADRAPPLPRHGERPPRPPRARGQGDVHVRPLGIVRHRDFAAEVLSDSRGVSLSN